MEGPNLLALVNEAWPPRIRAAPPRREWMDRTPNGHAYRCLPLNIANAHGWELLSPAAFTASWDGGAGPEAVRIESVGRPEALPVSHFGSGILTFDIQAVLRTSPHWNLWVTGPINRPKDGISPLSAVIETDWLPYAFTMNWQFTRPGHRVTFEVDEPFCHFFPLPRGYLETISPEVSPLSAHPVLEADVMEWSLSRERFRASVAGSATHGPADRWQKCYYRGVGPDGTIRVADHCTKLRLKPFTPVTSTPGSSTE